MSTEVPAKKIKVETSGRSTPKSRSPDRDKSSREGKEKSKQPRLLQEIDIFKPQAERDREVAAMARERERMKERDKGELVGHSSMCSIQRKLRGGTKLDLLLYFLA